MIQELTTKSKSNFGSSTMQTSCLLCIIVLLYESVTILASSSYNSKDLSSGGGKAGNRLRNGTIGHHLRKTMNTIENKPDFDQFHAQVEAAKNNVSVDACDISSAMERSPRTVSSYFGTRPIVLPSKNLPHLSSALCVSSGESSSRNNANNGTLLSHDLVERRTTTSRAIFSFKAARTGSHFFTDVVFNSVGDTGRPVAVFWEPFCSRKCKGPPTRSVTYEEDSLRKVLTQSCEGTKPNCYPSGNCTKLDDNEHGTPIYITAANPRFFNLNEMHWDRVFQGIPEPRIFSLRRTNLVLMAFSKFHHGGCAVDPESEQLFGRAKKGPFTFEAMMLCIEHYALGDQEVSSSAAFQASVAASGDSTAARRPFLVVYEDVESSGRLVQKGLLRYLDFRDGPSLSLDEIDIFTEESDLEKMHNASFCDYQDVDCTRLKERLSDHHPCLLKQLINAQLTDAGERHAWSVPMLADGLISTKGDCYVLETLTEEKNVRTFEDLYLLEAASKLSN